MFAYKNYMKLFSLFLVAFASSTAAAAHNNDEQQQQQQLIGGGSFQLHGLHGEGHQCQDLSQLSSAVVSLIKMVDQHEQQQEHVEEEEGHHRVLGTCDGVSQGCTAAWCCFVCGWNCRRTRTLRGGAVDEIDSSTNFLLPAAATASIIEDEAPTKNNQKVNAGDEVITVNLNNNGSDTDNYPSSPECDGVSSGCTAWWCCTVCGWNCRRNLVEETNNALAWLEEGEGNNDLELPGCLAGANLKLVSPSVDGETDVVVDEKSPSSSNP